MLRWRDSVKMEGQCYDGETVLIWMDSVNMEGQC